MRKLKMKTIYIIMALALILFVILFLLAHIINKPSKPSIQENVGTIQASTPPPVKIDQNSKAEEKEAEPVKNKEKKFSFTERLSKKGPELCFDMSGKFNNDLLKQGQIEVFDTSKSKRIQKIIINNNFEEGHFDWPIENFGYNGHEVQLVDLNFDGYLDLRLLDNEGATGNNWYASFLYDPGNIHIAACWDADRLDLGRVGKTPSAEFMNTDVGKKIAGQIVESKYLRSDVDDNVKNYVCRLIESHESRREPMGKDDLTQKQKDVYKVVKAIFEETGNMNVFGTEIKNKYQQLHGRPMQLLLSDLCYNRVNVGPDHEAKFLFYEKSGAYRFVDFAAESDIRIPIIWNPKGKNVPRELSGRQFCVGQYYQGKYNWDFTDIRAF